MRSLLFIGVVTLAFGLATARVQGETNLFSTIHIGIGGLALALALFDGLRDWRRVGRAMKMNGVSRSLILLLMVVLVGAGIERLAANRGTRLDLTFERHFELAPATLDAIAAVSADPGEPFRMTLFHDPNDPRVRRTRLLLEEISRNGGVEFSTRLIENSPEEEDRFGIGASNSLVLELGPHWALVERPTEGAIFEAVSALRGRGQATIYITSGSGEGNIDAGDATGHSGFAVALQTEGYDVRPLPSAAMSEVPEDADAVVVIAPARRLRGDALAALQTYLERGGSLVAFIEPGRESGIEALLAGWGMKSPDAIVVDPLSRGVDGEIEGLSPIVFQYAKHPLSRGLKKNRSTIFRRARPFDLRKPQREDQLDAVAFSSPYGWRLEEPLAPGTRELPRRPSEVREGYQALVVAGRFEREQGETRIAAFGDADFASNRYLRAVYNLDLAMNAVAWVLDRDEKITIRPKSGGLIQFPVPVESSLGAFYGVGLLVPELLLLAGGLIWLRRRSG